MIRQRTHKEISSAANPLPRSCYHVILLVAPTAADCNCGGTYKDSGVHSIEATLLLLDLSQHPAHPNVQESKTLGYVNETTPASRATATAQTRAHYRKPYQPSADNHSAEGAAHVRAEHIHTLRCHHTRQILPGVWIAAYTQQHACTYVVGGVGGLPGGTAGLGGLLGLGGDVVEAAVMQTMARATAATSKTARHDAILTVQSFSSRCSTAAQRA